MGWRVNRNFTKYEKNISKQTKQNRINPSHATDNALQKLVLLHINLTDQGVGVKGVHGWHFCQARELIRSVSSRLYISNYYLKLKLPHSHIKHLRRCISNIFLSVYDESMYHDTLQSNFIYHSCCKISITILDESGNIIVAADLEKHISHQWMDDYACLQFR